MDSVAIGIVPVLKDDVYGVWFADLDERGVQVDMAGVVDLGQYSGVADLDYCAVHLKKGDGIDAAVQKYIFRGKSSECYLNFPSVSFPFVKT